MKKGVKTILATYISTPKNKQVDTFYSKLGFKTTKSNDLQKNFIIQIEDYKMNNLPYIKIN